MAIEEEKKFKETVDLNKKAMCQFIQAFLTMNFLGKVNLQKKAKKQIPSGRAWKHGWDFKVHQKKNPRCYLWGMNYRPFVPQQLAHYIVQDFGIILEYSLCSPCKA